MASICRFVGQNFLQSSFRGDLSFQQVRFNMRKHVTRPKKQNPSWFARTNRIIHDENLTKENKEFLSEVLHDRHGLPTIVNGVYTYPKSVIGENENSLLKMKQIEPKEFNSKSRRCGLLARKIGVVPLWKKNGTRILTTMLQVDDNHVIRYIPPEEYVARQRQETWKENGKFACLLVGASSCDPSLFTKAYCGLFAKSGVLPKRHLSRFNITPDAELLPGTPLNVNHFKVGDYVDVRGTTVYRGFQGVMKRWGFKGMPATHGATKTHRRPGCIGSGAGQARVRPGQKMPGIMGGYSRILRGLKIWRINTKYNVMWVSGPAVPGEINTVLQIFDTMLYLKRRKISPPFPSCFEELGENGEDIWDPELHDFRDPTITFSNE